MMHCTTQGHTQTSIPFVCAPNVQCGVLECYTGEITFNLMGSYSDNLLQGERSGFRGKRLTCSRQMQKATAAVIIWKWVESIPEQVIVAQINYFEEFLYTIIIVDVCHVKFLAIHSSIEMVVLLLKKKVEPFHTQIRWVIRCSTRETIRNPGVKAKTEKLMVH